MSDLARQPRVSIIIPTENRTHLLPDIIDCFNRQTWTNKELLILDNTLDGKNAIAQLQRKYPNASLWHINEKCSIGSKRNQLIQKASGELIAHFDDDDYYAPTYIETLARILIHSNADLVKLSGWFCFHEASNTLGYWDTRRKDLPHTIFTGNDKPTPQEDEFTKSSYYSFLTGYGFSYIFRKKIWTDSGFNDISHGEDSTFHDEALAKKGAIRYVKDNQGICLHIIHSQNTSKCFPNFLIPNRLAPKLLIKAIQKIELQYTPISKHKQNMISLASTLNNNEKERKNQAEQKPLVSICTITYNRREYLPLILKCIENQNYPLDRLEWIVVDDSDNYTESLSITSSSKLRIKYKRLIKHIPLGAKRNISHRMCSGEYIVYMDDDDYYYPERVSHAVDTLIESKKGVAGSTKLLIYFNHDDQIWISGPFGKNHATAGTFAMTKDFARQHFYENEAMCNEEKSFLKNYTIPLAQLEPTKTMICLSHNKNTFDKRRMRANGATKNMRPLTPQQSHSLKQRLGQAGYRVMQHIIERPIQETTSELLSKQIKPSIALVCGPWGSGTSAVCTLINALGIHAQGPFYKTGDPLTPVSFEMDSFNILVRELVDETTLLRKAPIRTIREKLITFSNHFISSGRDSNCAIQLLKTPACSALLDELNNVFSLKLLICMRDLESIEQSRLRRRWPRHLGRIGAGKIYVQVQSFINTNKIDFIHINHEEVVDPLKCKLLIPRLSNFLAIEPSPIQIETALKAVTRSE